MILDGWRLAVGMFTAIPVAAPRTVDSRRAGLALLVSSIAFAPWALLVGAVLWLGASLGISPLPLAVVGVAATVLGNRGFQVGS